MRIPEKTLGSLITGQTPPTKKTEPKKTEVPKNPDPPADPKREKGVKDQRLEELRQKEFREYETRQRMYDYLEAKKKKQPDPEYDANFVGPKQKEKIYDDGGIKVIRDNITGKRTVEGGDVRMVDYNDKGEKFEARVDKKYRLIRIKYNNDGSVSVNQIPGKDWRERVNNFYKEVGKK
ncbi:hypothetical protein L0152_12815 [bacterium]|nr:hypothetical protein [bacterium]